MGILGIEQRDGAITVRKKNGERFRILQLTDIHIGGGFLSARKDKKAVEAVRALIAASNADFVVVTGDIAYPLPIFSGTNDNMKAAKIFGGAMKDAGVPWTFVFGNHDCESFSRHSKEEIADYYLSFGNCWFLKGDNKISGCGNFAIRLENEDGSLNQILMMIDSNAYVGKGFFSGFDTIHDDQIEWYKREITRLSPKGEPARSLAFFHIPPKEFKEAWEKCYRGDQEAVYRLGFVQEKDNYFGYPKTKEGNFFREMVDFGSCKGMFMGHDHLNTLSLDYRGIRLTYGMSIDYLAYAFTVQGFKKRHTQRGGTLIDIFDDGNFNIELLPLDDIKSV